MASQVLDSFSNAGDTPIPKLEVVALGDGQRVKKQGRGKERPEEEGGATEEGGTAGESGWAGARGEEKEEEGRSKRGCGEGKERERLGLDENTSKEGLGGQKGLGRLGKSAQTVP